MDLTTNYLGKTLKNPLVVSASPLSESVGNIRKMEDCGAAAVVLYSLFEEQLALEQRELHYHTTAGSESFYEALSYFPEPDEFRMGPEAYLEHIRKAKAAVNIPVIASLNGCTIGGWTSFAKNMQDAGADAIELNIYNIPTDINLTGEQVENNYLEIVRSVKSAVSIPVAVKLSPYFSNMANMAKKLVEAGANGLVMFNRFYQPDIDLTNLEVKPNVLLSGPAAMRLPMRWIAILRDKLNVDFAATSGIHSALDVIKVMMVGANVAMLNSVLLKDGIDQLKAIESQLTVWLIEREYESVRQMQGSMSQKKVEDAGLYERAQYMKALTYYKL
jgi:dihydroorotate dehydrogenase (fumarate)